MKCQHCNSKEATTYIKRTVNGKTTEMRLCADCAAELGYSAIQGMPGFGGMGAGSPFDLLGAVFGNGREGSGGQTRRCSACGISFDEIASSGRAGCPDCYTFFEKELAPTVRRIHGSAKHIGRLPQSASAALRSERELEGLREQMKKAIETQNFEEAASLRDRIRELEAAVNQMKNEKDKKEGA